MKMNVKITYVYKTGELEIYADEKKVDGFDCLKNRTIPEWFNPFKTPDIIWKGFVLEIQEKLNTEDIEYEFISTKSCKKIFKKNLLQCQERLNLDNSTNYNIQTPITDFILTEDGIKYCGNDEIVVIPYEINGVPVTRIAPHGFKKSAIKTVIMPETIISIGEYAFLCCSSLTSISLPDNISFIDSYAFDQCLHLKELILPDSIEHIGQYAFSETAITEISLPNRLNYLGHSLFLDCENLKYVYLQEGIEKIPMCAFQNCTSLQSIDLPRSIKTIENQAFYNCVSLAKINIPQNIKSLAPDLFNGCIKLKKIEINDINKEVEVFAMPNCLQPILLSIGLDPASEKPQFTTISNIFKMSGINNYKVVNPTIPNTPNNSNTFIGFDETNYVHLLDQGVNFKHQGKFKEAKDMYIKAIHIDNMHPMAYYNLGKVLYILSEYEASAKSYKNAHERGICEVIASTSASQLNNSMQQRVNPISFFVALGHSILDPLNTENEYCIVIKQYREQIEALNKKGAQSVRATYRTNAYTEYDKRCITASEKYLELGK